MEEHPNRLIGHEGSFQLTQLVNDTPSVRGGRL
jgi:hypothetical protein